MRYGSPDDRGKADAWYGRRFSPHKMVSGRYVTDLTKTERCEYEAAFNRAIEGGEAYSKDYGEIE